MNEGGQFGGGETFLAPVLRRPRRQRAGAGGSHMASACPLWLPACSESELAWQVTVLRQNKAASLHRIKVDVEESNVVLPGSRGDHVLRPWVTSHHRDRQRD